MTTRVLRHLAVPMAALTIAALAACAGDPAAESTAAAPGFPVTVDSCGRAVTFTEPPQRVLTAGSVAAPIVAAAGAGDRVVTRSYEASPFPGEYAEQLREAELVSPTAELNQEEIIARTPDVVVTFASTSVEPADLEAVGIRQLVTRGYCSDAKGSFDDIFDDITLYGQLFGTAEQADAEVRALRDRVAAVTATGADSGRGRTAATVILSPDGSTLKAYGATSTSHHQMAALGLANVFADQQQRLVEINAEELIDRDPAVIVLLLQREQTPEDTIAALGARPGLAGVDAVAGGQIIAIPFGYSGPSPVAVEGLEILQGQLADL